METKDQKKPLEWMKIAKFIIFCMSCIAAVMIFFYSQQDKTTYEISQNYVNKFEMQIMQKEIEILKLEMRDFKVNFNSQIAKMEDANASILELITDIRLTLAERKND